MQRNTDIVTRSLVGDLRAGGWLATGIIYGDTDAVSLGQNLALRGRSFAGFDDTEEREFFNGHVLETPSFSFDAFSSQTPWRAGTANYRMTGRVQDIAFAEVGSPSNDHQIAPTMRLSDCFEHVLARHCNFVFDATETPDGIIFETDYETSDTALARFNFNKSNHFWSAVVSQLGGGEEGGVQFFRPRLTRFNVLRYHPPPHFMTTPPTSRGTLTKEHMRGTVRVTVRNATVEDQVGQVQLIAVGSANTVYEARYPATEPGDGRIVEMFRGVWADSQSRANTLAQNLYEWLTRPYTLQVQVDPGLALYGDDGAGLELGDRVDVTYDGPSEDTATGAGVHLDLDGQAFFVYKVQINFDHRSKQARCVLELEADN